MLVKPGAITLTRNTTQGGKMKASAVLRLPTQMAQIRAYPLISRRKFLGRLRPLVTPDALSRIATAYQFAKAAHRGQPRDSGERYFDHPRAVAWILITELKIRDWRVIVDALLHDTIEDTYLLKPENIQRNFGSQVVLDIQLLTKRPRRGYLPRMRDFGSIRVLLVKGADRLHNLRTLSGCKSEKQRRQILETRNKYLPLMDVLVSRLPKKNRWQGEYLKARILEIVASYESKFAAARRV